MGLRCLRHAADAEVVVCGHATTPHTHTDLPATHSPYLGVPGWRYSLRHETGALGGLGFSSHRHHAVHPTHFTGRTCDRSAVHRAATRLRRARFGGVALAFRRCTRHLRTCRGGSIAFSMRAVPWANSVVWIYFYRVQRVGPAVPLAFVCLRDGGWFYLDKFFVLPAHACAPCGWAWLWHVPTAIACPWRCLRLILLVHYRPRG